MSYFLFLAIDYFLYSNLKIYFVENFFKFIKKFTHTI